MRKIALSIFFIPILLCFQCKNNKADNKADRELLDSLNKKCTQLYLASKISDSSEVIRVARALEKEAIRQGNDAYIGLSYGRIANYYQLHFGVEMRDSIIFYVDKAKEFLTKAERRNGALQIETDYLGWEIEHGNLDGTIVRVFDLIRDAEAFGKDYEKMIAYNTLGMAYITSNNPKDAINAFQNQLQYVRKSDPKQAPLVNINSYVSAFYRMLDAANQMGNNDLALAYSDSVKFYIEKYSRDVAPPVTERLEMLFYITRVIILSDMNKPEEARPFAEKLSLYCDNLKVEEQTDLWSDCQLALAKYYFSKKEYNKALSAINNKLHYVVTALDNKIVLNGAKKLKSEILAARGEYEEAFLLMKEVSTFVEEEAMKNSARQLSEMYTIYNVDKLEKQSMEDKAKAHNSQVVVIFLIVICIFLITITLIIKRNFNRLKKKNERIFAQYQQLDKYRNEVRSLSLQTEQQTGNNLKEPSLFDKTEEYLLKTHCYTDPDISRESLALQIGTNRQYLTQAIQDNINMTFTEYINNFRLEYARVLLSENTDLSIENIYTSSGFINKSTFYRLFKLKYDLTPKEFRDIALTEMRSFALL